LVAALPAARVAARKDRTAWPGEACDDPFCAFWLGDDSRIHAELLALLEEARIPSKTIRREDHLFNLSNYPAFQIGVPFSQYEKAEMVVKEAYELDPTDRHAIETLSPPSVFPESSESIRKLPETLTPRSEENIPGPPTDGNSSDVSSEEATVEVWSGDDSSLRDMLVASLRENQIPVHEGSEGPKRIIFVLPEDEERAREIVREVVEATPPK